MQRSGLPNFNASVNRPRPASAAAGGDPFNKFVLRSFVLHIVLIVAILIASFIDFSPKKEPHDVLTEFTVAVPPPAPDAPEKQETAEPKPEPEPQPEIKPEPDAIAEPVKKTKKKNEIKISKTIVSGKPQPNIIQPPQIKTKPLNIKSPKFDPSSKLSEQDIQKLIDAGARPSDHTSIPADEQSRCEAIIHDTLKQHWIRPDASNMTSRPPQIEITLSTGGFVSGVRLISSSGNARYDDSVVSAAKSVRQFRGLTPRYVSQNKKVQVTFKLESL